MGEKLGFTSHYKVMNKKDGVNLTLTDTSCAENVADLSSVILRGGADKSFVCLAIDLTEIRRSSKISS